MLPLGTSAPDFTLGEPATGRKRSLSEFSAPATVIMFICNHCPFVIHARRDHAPRARLRAEGVAFIGINERPDVTSAGWAEHMAALVRGWAGRFVPVR
jgi:hypothetical protein